MEGRLAWIVLVLLAVRVVALQFLYQEEDCLWIAEDFARKLDRLAADITANPLLAIVPDDHPRPPAQ